jgi:general secretion pathway protein G
MSKSASSLWPQGSGAGPLAERATTPTRRRNAGFTLIEWLIALTLLATLAGIAIPAYTNYVNRANIAQAKTDIRTLELLIGGYEAKNGELPDTLADIGHANFPDPWGNSYRYLRIAGAGLKGNGSLRKDRFLVPLNSDYDLYSIGKDGASKLPLTAAVSRDDIIRANNGAFIGVAVDY